MKTRTFVLVICLILAVVCSAPTVVTEVLHHDRLDGYDPNDHIDWTSSDANLTTLGIGDFGYLKTTNWLQTTEMTPPTGNPPANTIWSYLEDIHGFSFLSFKDSTGMIRKFVRDSVIVVKNERGSAIAAGRIVYATGSADTVPTVDLAKADAEATMPAIGVTLERIVDGAYGRVMQTGLLENVNTNSFSAGDVLYVSDTTAGIPKNTIPVTPSLKQEIGTILVSDSTAGRIQIVSRSVQQNETGTAQNTFLIGDGTSGGKTLTFNAVTDGSIIWDETKFDLDGAPLYTSDYGRFDGGMAIGVDPIIRLLRIYKSSNQGVGLDIDNLGAGDAVTKFSLGGVSKFSAGVDATDGKYKIAEGTSLGSNDALAIDSNGDFDFYSGNFANVGTIGCGAITGGTYNTLSILPSGNWIYLSGDGTIGTGLDIAIPITAGNDFFYGYGGTEHHKFGNSSQVEISDDGIITAVSYDGTEIFNSGGDLKVMPDVQGNVILFGDTDVAASEDGKEFQVWRKAPAPDADYYFRIWIDQYNRGRLTCTAPTMIYGGYGDIQFQANAGGSGGDIYIQPSANANLYIFSGGTVGSGENPLVYQTGYITADTAGKWISWQVEDTNDYFVLDREDTYIAGFKINMPAIVMDKLAFTQTDLNEYIDSLADGYMDYGATTAHRFNTPVRSSTASYRRYYHLSVGGFDPGASGATWIDPDGDTTGGWQLNTSAEKLIAGTDVHADWDGVSDIMAEIRFALNDTAGGDPNVDLQLIAYYNGVGDTSTKTQTVEVITDTDGTQYKVYSVEFALDYDATDNVIEAGDHITFILNLETDTSEIDDVIITEGTFYYNTTHTGIESGDT